MINEQKEEREERWEKRFSNISGHCRPRVVLSLEGKNQGTSMMDNRAVDSFTCLSLLDKHTLSTTNITVADHHNSSTETSEKTYESIVATQQHFSKVILLLS